MSHGHRAAAEVWLLWAGLADYRPVHFAKTLFGLEWEIGTKMLCHLDLMVTKVRFGAAPRSGFGSATQRTGRKRNRSAQLQHDDTP